jgi:hypothetical protein
MQLIRHLITVIALALPLFTYAAYLADDIEPGDGTNEIQLPLTKKTAAELIHLEKKGQILSVDTQKFKGKIVFKIKVLQTGGIIRHYLLDPITGHPPH